MRRTGMRWLEDFEKDLTEMKAKRLRQKTVNREKCASAIDETRPLEGRSDKK
jgi:hypothetical protein